MVDDGKMVTLQMTPAHAQAVIAATDLLSRLMMGQFEEIGNLARQGVIQRRMFDSRPADLNTGELDRLDTALMEIKKIFGHPRGGSFGIGANIRPAGNLAYEVQKIVEQALAVDRGVGFPNVASDGLIVRYSDLPAPTASVSYPPPAQAEPVDKEF